MKSIIFWVIVLLIITVWTRFCYEVSTKYGSLGIVLSFLGGFLIGTLAAIIYVKLDL